MKVRKVEHKTVTVPNGGRLSGMGISPLFSGFPGFPGLCFQDLFQFYLFFFYL